MDIIPYRLIIFRYKSQYILSLIVVYVTIYLCEKAKFDVFCDFV